MLLKRSTILIVLLVLLVGLTATSASAANANANKKASTDLVFTPVETPQFSAASSQVYATAYSVYTIKFLQTNWHGKYIPSGCPGYYLDLNWGNSANSLRLRVYGADGRAWGPFYDNSDGRSDGRILFWVSSPSGTLAPGTYYHEVFGYCVSGTEDYTV